MNFKKNLGNPFLLVAQGFIGGAILFFAFSSPLQSDHPSNAPAQATSSAKNIGA